MVHLAFVIMGNTCHSVSRDQSIKYQVAICPLLIYVRMGNSGLVADCDQL